MSEISGSDRAAELRARIEADVASGDLAMVSTWHEGLGDVLAEQGDREGAESAYRQAVAVAREIGPDDGFAGFQLMWAFRKLIHFLAPSEEAVQLGAEVLVILTSSDEEICDTYVAEAASVWATASLRFAELQPDHLDKAIGSAKQAIEMWNRYSCFGDHVAALQAQVAKTLRVLGRGAETVQ